MKATEASKSNVLNKFEIEIQKLHQEIVQNNGIIPAPWFPFINSLLAALQVYQATATGSMKIISTVLIDVIKGIEAV